MKCPKCAVDMSVEEHSGISVDVCPSCRGIVLDKGEPEAIDRLELGAVIEGGAPAQGDAGGAGDARPAHCHECDNPMITLTGAGDVEFDWCDSCERIFFDRGELSAFDAFSD